MWKQEPMKKLLALLLLSPLVVSEDEFPLCEGDFKAWTACSYTWSDGRKYVGEWKDGNRNGQGTFTYSNGDRHIGTYKDDKKHGQGTFTYSNGDSYEGTYKDDKKHGQGTYTFSNGEVLAGEWKDQKYISKNIIDGKYLGHGSVEISVIGNAYINYIGELKGGKPHGQGSSLKILYYKKDRYFGKWRKGKKHGQGTYTWDNGDKYVGEYKDDMIDGEGTYTWAGGNKKYVGEWRKNYYHGNGTLTNLSYKYVGRWYDGVRNGQGTDTYANGSKYVGAFKDDRKQGHGTHTYQNGDKYVGGWLYNKYDGLGTYFFANGDVDEGKWKKDERHGAFSLTRVEGTSDKNVFYENVYIGNDDDAINQLNKYCLDERDKETRLARYRWGILENDKNWSTIEPHATQGLKTDISIIEYDYNNCTI